MDKITNLKAHIAQLRKSLANLSHTDADGYRRIHDQIADFENALKRETANLKDKIKG